MILAPATLLPGSAHSNGCSCEICIMLSIVLYYHVLLGSSVPQAKNAKKQRMNSHDSNLINSRTLRSSRVAALETLKVASASHSAQLTLECRVSLRSRGQFGHSHSFLMVL